MTGGAATTAEDEDLIAYVCGGPLLAICGLTAASVRNQLPEWKHLTSLLCRQLGFSAENLTDIQRLRVHRYYLPVCFWVQQQLEAHRRAGKTQALVLGISAPQGCGKSTIVESLETLFNSTGTPTASVSIDDFYLTRADQALLAQKHPDNRILQVRGNAGTHDLELGSQTLRALKGLTQPEAIATVPRYDKSAYGGLGDRAPASTWPKVSGPLQLVLFEGWMLGFAAVPEAAARAVEESLVEVNSRLAAYKEAWDAHVDAWLVVKIGSPQWVFKWRLQAEEKMKASGKAGMSDAQIHDFVSRYMPAYTAYLPGLYRHGPTTATAGSTLVIEVDEARASVASQPALPPALQPKSAAASPLSAKAGVAAASVPASSVAPAVAAQPAAASGTKVGLSNGWDGVGWGCPYSPSGSVLLTVAVVAVAVTSVLIVRARQSRRAGGSQGVGGAGMRY